MSTCVVPQNLRVSSPLKMFQASCRTKEKQGIVAILGSDSERSKVEPSLRRTLSADMSSQKWISHMKKVASSEEISVSIDGSDGIWNSIQQGKKKIEAAESDIWSSIKSQKDVLLNSSKSSVSPYVHPLDKRSASSLSEKSLEICTESLGSETGSDGFSSYLPSENRDADDDDEKQHDETQTFEPEEWRPVKYSYKKSPPRSFPPPLPSLSGPEGETLRMQPRRDNGRLVLEVMAVPSKNNFRAHRQDGRLVLTLVNRHFIKRVEDDDQFEEEKDDEEQTEEEADTKKEQTPESPCGLLNAHRLAVMMNSKSIVLANRNQSTTTTPFTHSLPPRPKVAQPLTCPSPPPPTTATAAASLNAYEYYWRSKPTAKATAAVNPLGQQPPSFKNSSRKLIVCKNRTENEEQQLVMSNGSCKEVRRSLLFWEPRCIATS